jgi:hypothetical protein
VVALLAHLIDGLKAPFCCEQQLQYATTCIDPPVSCLAARLMNTMRDRCGPERKR